MFNRLDHIGIAVADVPAIATFFRDVLRLPVQDGNRGVYVTLGNAFLWIYESDSAGDPVPERGIGWRANAPGIDHFALEVDDIEAAGAELETRGVVFPGPVVDATGGIRYRGFPAPGGVMLYLLQQA